MVKGAQAGEGRCWYELGAIEIRFNGYYRGRTFALLHPGAYIIKAINCGFKEDPYNLYHIEKRKGKSEIFINSYKKQKFSGILFKTNPIQLKTVKQIYKNEIKINKQQQGANRLGLFKLRKKAEEDNVEKENNNSL